MADLIVVDSISQSKERGDASHAIHKGLIDELGLIELGDIISGVCQGRTNDDQITIADLTGLAVQDIQIAKAIYE